MFAPPLVSDLWLVGLALFQVHGLFVDRWHLFLTRYRVSNANIRNNLQHHDRSR